MDNKSLITGIVVLSIAVILTMGVMIPVIGDATTSTSTQINTQDGAGTLRFVYDTSPSTEYVITYSGNSGVTVTNGSDTQSLPSDESSILYADSNFAMWYDQGHIYVLGTENGNIVYYEPDNPPIVITREAEGVSITYDTLTELFGVPTYAFIPVSTGTYGFFPNGTEVEVQDGVPNPIVGGGFAGVYAYNDTYRYDGLGLHLHMDITDGVLSGAEWNTLETVQGADLGAPMLSPSVKGGETDGQKGGESGGLRAVPTPTYTDGDWGYNLTTKSGETVAIIVSYSGASGGVLTVPATVGGYPVFQLGSGNYGAPVVDTGNFTLTGLIISEGIKQIGGYAFAGMYSRFTGNVSIPSTVTYIDNGAFNQTNISSITISPSNLLLSIGSNAFSNTKLTGSLIIPDRVETVSNGAFGYSTLNGDLVIPASVTTIGDMAFQYNSIKNVIIASNATPGTNAFNGNTTISEVLDLSDTVDYDMNRYGIPATATVSDSIGNPLGYISWTEDTETVTVQGILSPTMVSVLMIVPIVMLAGIAVGVVRHFKE